MIDYSQQGHKLPLSLVGSRCEAAALGSFLRTSSGPALDSRALTLALFSLKESAVKVISPHIDHYIDLLDLELHVEGEQLYIAYHDYPARLRLYLAISEQEIFTFAIDQREHHAC